MTVRKEVFDDPKFFYFAQKTISARRLIGGEGPLLHPTVGGREGKDFILVLCGVTTTVN